MSEYFETHHGATQHTVSPIPAVANSSGVLGTATTSDGGLLTRDIRPTDLVRVGAGQSMEVTVDQAVSYGFLTKNPDGTYADRVEDSQGLAESPSRSSESSPTSKDEMDSPESSEGVLEVSQETNETLENWSMAIQSFTGNKSAVIGVIGDIMAKGPDHVPDVIKSMCIEQGVDYAQAKETIRNTAQDVNNAMVEYVAALGVEPDTFFNYVHRTIDPAAFSSAITSAMIMRDLSPMAELVRRFKASGQGLANRDIGQAVKVTIKGREVEMDQATARRLGYI